MAKDQSWGEDMMAAANGSMSENDGGGGSFVM